MNIINTSQLGSKLMLLTVCTQPAPTLEAMQAELMSLATVIYKTLDRQL